MPPTYEVQRPNRRLNRRLDSWKEIASFFDRDERTVKRWEKERALPVHRLPGGSRARVFAFTEELTRWMHSPDAGAADVLPAVPPTEASEPKAEPVAEMPVPTLSLELPDEAVLPPQAPAKAKTLWIIAGSALVILLAVAIAMVVRRHGTSASSEKQSASSEAARKTVAPAKPDAETEELYLKGRYYWHKRTPVDLNKAVDYFTQAIVHSPSYAPAYVGLADCYNLLREFADMPPEEAFPRALAAAQKAVELDASSAEAHASLAFVMAFWKWDFAGADREFRRAIQLNPSYATAHHWYANFLMLMGRTPEALQEIERAQELDPSSSPILADKALILFNDGKVQEATALLKQIENSQPEFFSTHKYLSYIYLTQGDDRDYLAEATKAAQLSGDANESAVTRAEKQGFKSGGETGMLKNAIRVEKKLCAEGKFSPFVVATSYAEIGDKQEALQYLQLAYDKHDPTFVSLWSNASFATLHDDPAYRKLVAASGIPLAATTGK
jgi:tetratricopeptide (TPR) repeat protein